ncbi:MAG: glycogen synthase [Anaerolineae bacterium]|nr:glycogen synthase [Anaerolineae bacterium]
MADLSKVVFFTNEYPPNVYGGAGVVVEYLSQELAKLVPLEVRCFGDQNVTSPNLRVKGYEPWSEATKNTDPRFKGALDAVYRSLSMAKDTIPPGSVVHAHTWYTQFAGFLAKKLWGAPFVLTTHSLEPLRPWKVEQLGNAYHLSSWIEHNGITEADAVIAVSQETRNDVLRLYPVDPDKVKVIHNGIDLDVYQPDRAVDALVERGVDPDQPYVLFVGRITRQKGIIHLVNAIPHIDSSIQVVLLAGAPDTPEIGREMTERVAEVSEDRARHNGASVIWVQEMLPRDKVIQYYTNATVFCCPSVYEPFGIINLEAMACKTAVVASAVGGIPEVVVPGETGILVDLELKPGTFDPVDPDKFSRALAEGINEVALNPALREKFERKGRQRVEEHFSWTAVAEKTLELYKTLVATRDKG